MSRQLYDQKKGSVSFCLRGKFRNPLTGNGEAICRCVSIIFFLTSSIDQKYKWVFFISIHNQNIVCLRAKNQALADRIKDLICKNHILLKAGNMSTESPTQPSPNITDGNAFYLYLQQYIYVLT